MQPPLSNTGHTPQRNLTGYYKRLLRAREIPGGLESNGGAAQPDLSDTGITGRLDETGSELHRIIEEFLDNDDGLKNLADQIVAQGKQALEAVRGEEDDVLREDPFLLAQTEAVVRLDGSRPSFLIMDGEVNLRTSPVGQWSSVFEASANPLKEAATCVGRIDGPDGFTGTGFLLAENLILTNRHVLQSLGRQGNDGTWTLSPEAQIDFGREFRTTKVVRRALHRVVFAGKDSIDLNGAADHRKLDLALLELVSAPADQKPRVVLSLDASPDWADPEQVVFIMGYSGRPPLGSYQPTLMEQLFSGTYGYKRVAPGLVMERDLDTVQPWTVTHDATTLGGNSGSVVIVLGRETTSAGLHYGGRGQDPRANWGHVLGQALDQTDGHSETSLRQHLETFGVTLIDRFGPSPF